MEFNNEITLDELVDYVHTKESLIKESQEVQEMLKNTAYEIVKASKSGKVKVLTDYDTDGITSAYIMEKNIKAINPNCEVEVMCNDRRNSYGLKSFINSKEGNSDYRYIVCDMGTNELDEARKHFGDDVIIIDHHLTPDENIRQQFIDNKNNNACLCNPHTINKNDSKNAQYCTAGLTFRLTQLAYNICQKNYLMDDKTRNTVTAMACIGTATDMVNVLDTNSYNRMILKEGIKVIDNADENNFDFIIGNVLSRNKISENTTAHELAFNVGAFLNSASRMSGVMNKNGSQVLFDTLNGSKDNVEVFRQLNYFEDANKDRKAFVSDLTTEDYYKDFLNEQRFGKNKDDNIAIYLLPDNVPSAFAGLVAGRLTEACDKAIICLTYNPEKKCYTGSGRNGKNNSTSLIDYMKNSLKDTGIEITYGGHEDAIGISNVKDLVSFKKAIEDNKDKMLSESIDDKPILKISLDEINNPNTLKKMMEIEPIGMGLSIPPTVIEGKELRRTGNYIKKKRNDWKRVQIKQDNTIMNITDWSYSPLSYQQSGVRNNEIAVFAELGINEYKGKHIELSAKFNRNFIEKRNKEIEEEIKKNKPIER